MNKNKQSLHQIRCHPSIMKVGTLDESLHTSTLSKSTCRISTCHSSSSLDRSVSFHKVKIREYDMSIGDNPSCRLGPPVGITWNYKKEVATDLDVHENERGERRGLRELLITTSDRYDIIKESGVSSREIANTVRKVNRAKTRRVQTVNNASGFSRIEEGFESALRKVKRIMFRRNRDRTWWANWKTDHEDILNVSTHNGNINGIIHSHHNLDRISSEHEDEVMSEISSVSSGDALSSVAHVIKSIIIYEEEDSSIVVSNETCNLNSIDPVLSS